MTDNLLIRKDLLRLVPIDDTKEHDMSWISLFHGYQGFKQVELESAACLLVDSSGRYTQ